MTTETSAAALNIGYTHGSLSADEAAFFDQGGESEIPADTGSELAGDESATLENGGNGNPDGGNNSADPGAQQPADKGNKAPQHVPLAALQEERGKRKALGTEVETLKTQLAETNGKLAVLLGLKKPVAEAAAEQPAAPPSAQDDIFGAVESASERIARLEKANEDAAAARTEEARQTTFVNSYRADADAFTAKNADYRDAYNHLLALRADELVAIGFADPRALQAAHADPADVQAAAKAIHDALIADEMAIAQRAFDAKKSPAEIIYDLAKKRGYQKKSAPPAPGSEVEQSEAATMLDTIERGQNANKSLNGAGGSADGDAMTAEKLLAMSSAQFEKYADKNPDVVRRLMGG